MYLFPIAPAATGQDRIRFDPPDKIDRARFEHLSDGEISIRGIKACYNVLKRRRRGRLNKPDAVSVEYNYETVKVGNREVSRGECHTSFQSNPLRLLRV